MNPKVNSFSLAFIIIFFLLSSGTGFSQQSFDQVDGAALMKPMKASLFPPTAQVFTFNGTIENSAPTRMQD
ncbi:hypothetical protein [Portibacter marinus]|uniref:hypothetical protein n=1 Tax=Portibacter marinus TaxID=2898660 RepID=UPI001F2FCB14|nr:hypothetical protein [Portibacter marinus]